MFSTTASASNEHVAPELIDVQRIKLSRPGGATAVVSELRTADSVLHRWAEGIGFERVLSFEVTFVDGYTLCGSFEFGTSKRQRPSLTRLVQRVFTEAQGDLQTWPDGTAFVSVRTCDFSRYAVGRPDHPGM